MSVDVVVGGLPAELAGANIPQFVSSHLASRIAAGDPTVWGDDVERDASIRLGWVDATSTSRALIPSILALREQLLANGIDRFVLSGMGGSSLAAEMLARSANVPLTILDSTDPDQVRNSLVELTQTAVIVSSKSGTTLETNAHLQTSVAALKAAGIEPAERIIVVTDPKTPLAEVAKREGYRLFTADPLVGGRYSALTAFGLVPAGLAGVDIEAVLDEAAEVASSLAQDVDDNPAIVLGAAISAGAPARDKLGLVRDGSRHVGLSEWVEQLVAESTGKLGTGLLPVVLEADAPELSATPDDLQIVRFTEIGGLPSTNDIKQAGSLGGSILLWEYAVAIAGVALGINPFDQPDVERSKIAARSMLDHDITPERVLCGGDGITVSSPNPEATAATLDEAIGWLFGQLEDFSYIAIQAYLDRTRFPEAEELRAITAGITGRPVTFGWGPRYLHSTGQYHKGGPANGVFLQLTSEPIADLEIPGMGETFESVIRAQAQGDASVLAEQKLPVLSIHFDNSGEQIKLVANAIAGFAMVK